MVASGTGKRRGFSWFWTNFLIVATLLAPALVQASEELTRQLIRTVELKDWRRAEDLAALHPLDTATDLITLIQFIEDPLAADAMLLRAFLERRADWPWLYRLRDAFEMKAQNNLPAEQRLDYFTDHPPRTRQGRLAIAAGLFELDDRDQAIALLKDIWIEENFNRSDARYFMRLYGQHITGQDHERRLNRLLWDQRTHEASRLLDLVSHEQRALAVARIRLQQMSRGVDAAINAVPRSLKNDGGLAFDRMTWRRRKGRRIDMLEILENPPADLGRPDRWWPQQAHAVRDLFDRGDEPAARALASKHRQLFGSALAEASWLAGWLDLRAGDLDGAEREFLTFIETVSTPISKARGAYWLARTYARAGNRTKRDQWLDRAMAHPATFYGQAATRLAGRAIAPTLTPLSPGPSVIEGDERAKLALALCTAGERRLSEAFITRIGLDELKDLQSEPVLAVELAQRCKRPDLVIELGKRMARRGEVPVALSYPLPVLPPINAAPRLRAWSYAIMRQESHMDPAANSSADARGLMQLLPRTARHIARERGWRFGRDLLFSDIAYNVELGTAYFAQLLERFDGEAALALAAYNAGPSRVLKWLERYGDPRGRSTESLIDWIESIPFSETRNYVQRVIEAQAIYDWMLSSAVGLRVEFEAPNGPAPINRPQSKPAIRGS